MRRPRRIPEDCRDDDAPGGGGRRKAATLPALVLSVFLATGPALGQTISVSGDPSVMTVDSAIPGSPLDAVTEGSTTYSVSADSSATVLARLNEAAPSGVTLEVELEAPQGAVSQGFVELTTMDREVVTSIDPGSHASLQITYRLASSAEAGTVSLTGRDVVLTILHN